MDKVNPMANKDHLKHLTSKYGGWNEWRVQNPSIIPDLRGADLAGQLLCGGVNLSDTILDRANLNGADLREADLTRASIRNANIYDAHFNGAILDDANLSGSVIIRCSFPEAQFRGTKLRAEIQKVNFQRASFRGTDLSGVRFHECDFYGADLTDTNLSDASFDRSYLGNANLSGACMRRARLHKSNLTNADLSDADLSDADLSETTLVGTKLTRSILTNCSVYGTSVWSVDLTDAVQDGLIISAKGEPPIAVDNLEVAQFIYLLLNNSKIRDVIDTITSKAVLILGRFAPDRKVVLHALSDELRKRDYLPIIFDFDKPTDRDFTETVMTLAGMSKFIIADLTQPKSSPLESHAIITSYMIPFIPIIQEGEWPFAMFVDLQRKHHWVFNTLRYRDKNDLLQWVDKIITRADKKFREIQIEKAQAAQKPVSGEDW